MTDKIVLSNDLIPEVALPFMNSVHHEELELVNELLDRLAGSDNTASVSEQLNEWVEHTKAHFAREEHYMQEYNFPPYLVHSMEHESVLQQLLGVQQSWEESLDRDALAGYIRDTWVPWLQNHISTMDFVTAQFLSQFNIQVEL